MEKARMVAYCCGGTGVNQGRRLASMASAMDKKQSEFHVAPKIVYIDSSDANTKKLEADVYEFPDTSGDNTLRGSGGIRAENAKIFAKYTKDILQKNPCGDFNVLIHSGGGGSGSVIAALLAKEMLARGENVFIVMVGARDIAKHINNTFRTLKSYMGYAQEYKRPLPVFYFEQQDERHREDIDTNLLKHLACLMFAFSTHHAELDHMDVENWINYNRSAPFAPDLIFAKVSMGLTPEDAAEEIDSHGRIASSICFGEYGKVSAYPNSMTAYQTFGYESEDSSKTALGGSTMHISFHTGYMVRVTKELEKIVEDLNRDTHSIVVDSIRSTKEDGFDDETGLVL